MPPRGLPAVLLLLLLLAAGAGAQDDESCGKMYDRNEWPPLLFGGVGQAGRCKSQCSTRDDYWGKICAFNGASGWGTCNDQQAARALELGKTLGGGEAIKMTPCHVTKFIRGRTLWLIGDSYAKSLYRALQCFLIDFWNHQECQASTDSSAVQQLFNLPVKEGQSKCFHLLGLGGGRVCMVHVVLGTSLVNNNQVAEGGVLPLLRSKFARKDDIFYINFATWHKKTPEWQATYAPALEALGQYFQSTRWEWPHMLFRETPAEHPKASNGQSCMEMRGYTYVPGSGNLEVDAASRIKVAGWSSGAGLNAQARDILWNRYNLPITPAFNVSVPLHDNHIGTTLNPELDCLHYCSPGVPEMWIYYMYNAMRNGRAGIKQLVPSGSGGSVQQEAAKAPTYSCVPSTTMF